MLTQLLQSKKHILLTTFACVSMLGALFLSSCAGVDLGDGGLTRNTYVELVDWHISGLWVINCPVAWVRVANYNRVPIKDVVINYRTYDFEGHALNTGTYTLEGEIAPGNVKNFIEQYLGLVDLQTEKLSVQISAAHAMQ
jgi:hypothetical protein